MKRQRSRFIRGIRALTALALVLSMIPTSLASAAPSTAAGTAPGADQLVTAGAKAEPNHAGRSTLHADRVDAVPPVSAPQAPNAVDIVATKRDAVVNDIDGDGRADPGDTLRYTVVITNNGDTDATSVVFNDAIDDNTVLSGTIRSTPLARNDAYTAVGNVRIALAAGSGVLSNDSDPDGSALSVVSFSPTSANGGNVAVNADGSFTYNPPAGFEGADTFIYTIQDTDGNQDSATVTVTVSGMIWFINNNAGACSSGCNGRLTTPFTTLADFAAINNGTGNNPAANDNIFVYESATAYTGGVTLLNGQRLIGQDATNNLSAITGLTPPVYSDSFPAMNTGGAATALANSGGNGITVASNNTLRGLTVGNTTGAGISGTSFGTLTIGTAGSPDVTINDSGQALSLNTGTLAATLTGVTSNGGTNNIALTSVGGSLTSGSTSLNNATGIGLSVSSSSVTLNLGNTTVNSSGGTGVSLSSNSGSITFADLDITPDANQRALYATSNTGALSATSGTIATSNGIAVEVVGPSSASRTPLNLQLTSVSANGGASGIILSNTSVTGSPGGFTIAGSGGTCSTAGNCTGGAIQNTTGVGVSLANANNVSLTRLFIGNTGSHGISGAGMGDSTSGSRPTFEIRNSRLTSPGDADNETAMFFGNSLAPGNNTGRLVMADTIVEQFEENGLEVYNNSGALVIDVAGTLSGLTDSTTKFDDNSDVHGQQGIMAIAAGTAMLTFNVSGVYFNNIEFATLDARAEGTTASLDVNWTGNVSINGGGPDNFPSGGGFQIVQDKGGTATFDILNNNIRDLQGDGIVIIADGPTQGRINNNLVSGSLVGDGIRIDTDQLPGEGNNFTVTIQVQGNSIGNDATFPGIGDDGIQILHRDGTKTLNLTVENNTIANTASEAIRYFTDADVSDGALQPKSFVRFAGNTFTNIGVLDAAYFATQDTAQMCLHMSGNTLNGANRNIFLTQSGTSQLQITQASVAALAAANTGSTASSAGTITFNGTCTNPPLPTHAMRPAVESVAAASPVEELSLQPQGGNRKALFSPAFNPAFAPQADRAVEIDRVNAPIAPLTIGILPAGKTVTLTFEVVINNPVTPGVTQVSNQGTISGGNFASVLTDDPDTGAANDPTVTPLDIQVDLQVTKTVNPVTAYPGLPITYTITYLNAGPQASTNVIITDPLPSALTGVAYQSSGTTITATGSSSWLIGTLLAGQGGTITVTGLISSALAVPTTITNTATITGTGRDTNTSNNTASVGLPITDLPISGLSAANDSPTQLGSATHFTATITAGTNVVYQWNFGDGNTATGATAANTYAAIGTYTATVTATNSSNSQVATTVVIVVDVPISGLNATNDGPTRLGDATTFSATISAGSNVVYAWDFGDGATGSGASTSRTYAALGTYTATVTATNSSNQQVATTIVTVIDRPITGLNVTNDSPTQLGSVTNFTATISDGTHVNYQWNFGDGSLGSGATASHTYGAVGPYVATVTATNGVSVVVATTNVSIVDVPITGLTAANSSPTIFGSPTAFTATIGGGTNVTYQWDFGDGVAGSGANTSHTYGAIGTYTATVTATNGSNTQVATTVAMIFDTPITGLSATSDSPTRLGNATIFTATITGGSGISYAWDFGDGATGSGATPSHTYAALGTYTATVTATNTLNTQMASTVVVVIDQPILGLNAANDSPTRLGSVTSLTATISNGTNVTYQWSFGDGSSGGGANAGHTYSAVGSYVATVTATNGVSVVVATTNVSIIDTPIVNLAATNDSPTRLGSVTNFTATIGGGSNVTYQWNFGDGSLGSGATVPHTYGAVGAYVATVTATNGVSVVVATTNVSIIDRAIAGLTAANDSPTGLGNSTAFTATISDGTNVVYAWNFGDGNTATGASTSHTYAAVGIYTATVTATNGVSSVIASTVATIINQPISGLSAANDSPTRLGSVTTFTTTIATGSNVTYQWDFGDGSIGSGANTSHTYAAIGTYTATVTATNNLNSQTASTVVVVIDRAIVDLTAANDSPTRLGSTTSFTATIGDGSNVTYAWNFGDGSLGSGATSSHTYATVGAYVATVTATNGVSVVVATTNVSIIDTPIVNLAAVNSSPTGLNLSTFLTATIDSGSNVTYQWNFGDGATGSGATTPHIYPALGVYTATVTATNGVSNVVATTPVTIVDQPITTLNATSSSPTLLGNTSFLTATANGTSVIYTWDFGDGATGSGAHPSHMYAATGLYTAIVTATNSNGTLTATTRVNVFSGKVYLPLIMRNYVAAPDLVVTSLKVSTGSAQVVIKNQGDKPALDGFYVDVYINPNPVPTAVNQIWSDGRSAQGLTWGVTASLQPGQVLTLTIGDAYYLPDYSIFTGTLPIGTPVYAQVDSFDPSTTYGTVRENHEINGAPYNNILGPVLSATAFTVGAGASATHVGRYWLPVRLKVQ